MNLAILIDTREQRPLEFDGLSTALAALETGDYSCVCDSVDLRDVVVIERKSFWLSAWIKTGQNGAKFMSIALTAKSDQREGSSARATQNDDDIRL
jgi:hypothetical protein